MGVIKQVMGEWRTSPKWKSDHLRPIIEENIKLTFALNKMCGLLGQARGSWATREDNKDADNLATYAIDIGDRIGINEPLPERIEKTGGSGRIEDEGEEEEEEEKEGERETTDRGLLDSSSITAYNHNTINNTTSSSPHPQPQSIFTPRRSDRATKGERLTTGRAYDLTDKERRDIIEGRLERNRSRSKRKKEMLERTRKTQRQRTYKYITTRS
jgi:hypothetical protein